MNLPDPKKIAEIVQKLLTIMWPGFMATVCLYLYLSHVVGPADLSTIGISVDAPLRGPLWVVALFVIALLWWWNKTFLSEEAILGKVTKGENLRVKVFRSYLLRMVIAYALADAIALYGLVFALIGYGMWDQYLLSLVSWLFFVYLFPRGSFLDKLIKGYEARGGV